MARVTIERALGQCENVFELAVLASYRAHAIACGSQTVVDFNNKFAVMALREIEAGKIDIDELRKTVIEKFALESQVNVVKNSFIINDFSIKAENENIIPEVNEEKESNNNKVSSMNIDKTYFAE